MFGNKLFSNLDEQNHHLIAEEPQLESQQAEPTKSSAKSLFRPFKTDSGALHEPFCMSEHHASQMTTIATGASSGSLGSEVPRAESGFGSPQHAK